MIIPIDSRNFRIAYREAIKTSAHDPNLRFRLPGSSDWLSMHGYLAACETLYVEVLWILRRLGEVAWPAHVHDAGGSFGAFAAALRSLGVRAADDPASGDAADLVVGLALHEHTNSARTLATRGEQLLQPHGRLALVVPSSQYWPHRLAELRGREPATSDDAVVALGTPSYSRRGLRALLGQVGLRPNRICACDYSPCALGSPLRQTLAGAARRIAPQHREVWLALAARDRRA